MAEVSTIAVQEDVEETKSVIKEEKVEETVMEDALPKDEPIVEEISTKGNFDRESNSNQS